jgi:hypothetical protein
MNTGQHGTAAYSARSCTSAKALSGAHACAGIAWWNIAGSRGSKTSRALHGLKRSSTAIGSLHQQFNSQRITDTCNSADLGATVIEILSCRLKQYTGQVVVKPRIKQCLTPAGLALS